MIRVQGKSLKFNILFTLPLVLWLLTNIKFSASAQIIPDNTLPNNTIVTPNSDILEISGGTTVGSNLFHSFEQFSLLTGKTAFFNNSLSIENIISRVTGGSISNIDGLIRANGIANVFLINPNGIIFGVDASLNIGGSFISSTANSIRFADGSEFSATNPQNPPLLKINVPVGLQYGVGALGITVQGPGNNLAFNQDDFSVIRDFRPVGLQVQPGKTLALVGGNVVLSGGNLTAVEGRIELGSVGTGLVKIDPTNLGWMFNYEDVNSFQDIQLTSAASLEVSGNSGGTIQVQGRNIQVRDGSAMLADTLGNGSKGTLRIKALESVEVSGTFVPQIPFVSYLSTDVAPEATGDGGDLIIETGHLRVANGAQISSGTFSSGNAGTLTVKATEVELNGPSGLFTIVNSGSGNGGKLFINTKLLRVADGAQIAALTFDKGNAGSLSVQAKSVELTGTSPEGTPSGLFANVEAEGAGGNIVINTEGLRVVSGARIAASTFGSGKAGNLIVKATNVELIGAAPNGSSSGLFANVESGSSGDGGNITISAERLRLTEGGQIGTGTFSFGNAGSLTVQVINEVELIGGSADAPSSISTAVGPNATGNGGNLTIETGSLRLVNGGQIATSTTGSGNAGKLTAKATDIELIGFAEQGRSGLFASAVLGTGDAGDLTIETDNLFVKDGATISASNFSSRNPNIPPGQGKAGNIQIEARSILLDRTKSEQASITASTASGGGGNIVLQVQESLTARNGSQISAETKGSGDGGSVSIDTNSLALTKEAQISTNSAGEGNAGNISINANQIQTDRGKITAATERSGGGNINLTTDLLFLANNSLISTSVSDSTGGGGNIDLNADFIIGKDNSDIRANALFGPGGNIQIRTQGIFLDQDSEIDASSQFGIDGVVEITNLEVGRNAVDKLPDNVVNSNQHISNNCQAKQQNYFVVTGRGGLPENPTGTIIGQTIWADLGDIPVSRQAQKKAERGRIEMFSHASDNRRSPIIEAQGWIVNNNGQIELVADSPLVTPRSPSNTTHNQICVFPT